MAAQLERLQTAAPVEVGQLRQGRRLRQTKLTVVIGVGLIDRHWRD